VKVSCRRNALPRFSPIVNSSRVKTTIAFGIFKMTQPLDCAVMVAATSIGSAYVSISI
jgi:hypothetical protein